MNSNIFLGDVVAPLAGQQQPVRALDDAESISDISAEDPGLSSSPVSMNLLFFTQSIALFINGQLESFGLFWLVETFFGRFCCFRLQVELRLSQPQQRAGVGRITRWAQKACSEQELPVALRTSSVQLA